ncbi:hypothetical protein N0V82_000439 [Gnomoniopsis sp. IMI 355080]|nr:hypothetical protein N0V82_000439 [Gnomoniopsis sp. IMI 355080]
MDGTIKGTFTRLRHLKCLQDSKLGCYVEIVYNATKTVSKRKDYATNYTYKPIHITHLNHQPCIHCYDKMSSSQISTYVPSGLQVQIQVVDVTGAFNQYFISRNSDDQSLILVESSSATLADTTFTLDQNTTTYVYVDESDNLETYESGWAIPLVAPPVAPPAPTAKRSISTDGTIDLTDEGDVMNDEQSMGLMYVLSGDTTTGYNGATINLTTTDYPNMMLCATPDEDVLSVDLLGVDGCEDVNAEQLTSLTHFGIGVANVLGPINIFDDVDIIQWLGLDIVNVLDPIDIFDDADIIHQLGLGIANVLDPIDIFDDADIIHQLGLGVVNVLDPIDISNDADNIHLHD